tara:strand:+ start:121 stop:423 length:303 start_codon:yes stop_codon:yes gene_type:complete
MKINFKDSDDRTSSQIFIDNIFIGEVKLDIFTQKWSIYPSFKIGYYKSPETKIKYFSSYEAGKELVKLYQFFFPEEDEEQNTQEYGISLDDMLVFLKKGR